MRKAFTPHHKLENDCFADDVVEDAEETDIPLSSVYIGGRPLCNLWEADDTDLLGGSENPNNSLKDWRKQLLHTAGTSIKIRLAQAHSAMTRLAILWKNKAISFPTKIKLFKSPVLSILLLDVELDVNRSSGEANPGF